MTKPRSRLLAALALAFTVAWPSAALRAEPLERDWCTGLSPVSWGFSVTPPTTSSEIRLRASSPSVRVLSAAGGPSLPEGWTVELVGDAEIVARGATPVAAGQRLRSFLLLETNRSSSAIDQRGAHPVSWELAFSDSDGVEIARAPYRASFPPVLDLADAQSRGLVLVTVKTHGSAGPVEITVDNPSWHPVWLDLPPGTVLSDGSGSDWVVGLTRPFRMMRKQKTGRTIAAYPLRPELRPQPRMRRLQLAGRMHDRAAGLGELALAVRELEDRSIDGRRRPGRFEAFEPFEFWPMVFRWAVWQETSTPGPEVLQALVSDFLQSRARAGDPHAARVDPVAAAAEVEQARLEALELRGSARTGPSLAPKHRAARSRFR